MVAGAPECPPNHDGFSLRGAWGSEALWLSCPSECSSAPSLFVHGSRRDTGVFRGVGRSPGTLHATGSVRPVRPDGCGLLHGPCTGRVLASPEQGRAGRALLLYLPLPCSSRRWAVEPRPAPGKGPQV